MAQATQAVKAPRVRRIPVTGESRHAESDIYDDMFRELEDIEFGRHSLIEDTLHHFMN